MLEQLLGHGVLGVVAALALWFAYQQTRKAEECQNKRVADTERVVAAISESNQALRENTVVTARVAAEMERLNSRRSQT